MNIPIIRFMLILGSRTTVAISNILSYFISNNCTIYYFSSIFRFSFYFFFNSYIVFLIYIIRYNTFYYSFNIFMWFIMCFISSITITFIMS